MEHRGRTFGLVAPLYHQARVCAGHLAEQGLERYHFEGAATRLKIGGIDLLSAGDFLGGEGDQVITLDDPAGATGVWCCATTAWWGWCCTATWPTALSMKPCGGRGGTCPPCA